MFSKWMKNLFGQGRKQIEAQVNAAIAAGVWGISTQIELDTWNASSYRWVIKTDELVCEVCRPMDGMLLLKSEFIAHPAHWGCRCSLLPEESG